MTPILIALLALAFTALGTAKLLGAPPLVAAFEALRLGRWPRRIVGAAEVVLGLALGASVVVPPLTFFAALPLLAIALGAVLVHLLRPPVARALPALVLALGLAGAIVLQPLGLRIAMLPAADPLPGDLLPAETLATYAPGTFLESVVALEDGSLLISHTTGADFTRFDFSAAQGTVLRRAPDGSEETLFALPPGHVAGVGALGPEGTFYLTVAGATRGLWRFRARIGDGLFVTAPEGVSWNGLTLGPDGMLYAADDRGGAIWRIDPATGEARAALSDDRLAPRPFVSLAPGANGVEFRGRDLIVTVSDSGIVYRAPFLDTSGFGPLEELASGVPGDDIAIGPDGTVYITTHPYNTVVAIAPDGTRRIVADASTGATGSTDLALSADGTALWMVTDGGLFGGIAGAAGQLVRIDLASTLASARN